MVYFYRYLTFESSPLTWPCCDVVHDILYVWFTTGFNWKRSKAFFWQKYICKPLHAFWRMCLLWWILSIDFLKTSKKLTCLNTSLIYHSHKVAPPSLNREISMEESSYPAVVYWKFDVWKVRLRKPPMPVRKATEPLMLRRGLQQVLSFPAALPRRPAWSSILKVHPQNWSTWTSKAHFLDNLVRSTKEGAKEAFGDNHHQLLPRTNWLKGSEKAFPSYSVAVGDDSWRRRPLSFSHSPDSSISRRVRPEDDGQETKSTAIEWG